MIDSPTKHFVSDNNSACLPEVMQALMDVNSGHLHAYGGEFITEKAHNRIRELFGDKAIPFFVFNGTAANVTALQALCRPYHSVICSEHAHIHKDECSAPEVIARTKLLLVPTEDAKIDISGIEKKLIRLGDQHCSQAKVVSVTQPTELGTVYSIDELKEIVRFAKSRNLYVHMDGSRLVTAAVYLGKTLKELTYDLGIDVVSFGGTKNGLMLGEAVIFFDKTLARDFKYIRKQNLQLAGKMRFISAQFIAWLKEGVWQKYARHSIEMAKILEKELKSISGIEVTQKVQTNVVFAKIPKSVISKVRKKYFFYVWDEHSFECRLMTTFDTEEKDIFAFTELLKNEINLLNNNSK